MKIFKLVYFWNKNQDKIILFKPNFVHKNKNKCFINYNNKIYPLTNEFKITGQKNQPLIIKLICYDINLEIVDIFKSSNTFYRFYEAKKSYGKIKADNEKLKCFYHEMSKMIYKINPGKRFIKIYSDQFVKKNKDKCFIIYNDNIYPLKDIFSINDIKKGESKLEIFLIELEDVYDKSYMFEFCYLLEEYSLFEGNEKEFDINKIKVEKRINNDETSFYKTHDLNNTDNQTTGGINTIFEFYKKLSFLPNRNIQEWNTNIFINMSHMFALCTSLISIPYMSRWNVDNVTDMSSMFEGCTSLKSLPEIFKLNKNNKVTNMSKMFSKCTSLTSLPDISKWDTSKVTDMNQMFLECLSLKSLPDISNWNVENVTSFMKMFQGCESLLALPDLSKWKPDKICFIDNMFSKCSSLMSLPDISKWNTKNIEDFGYIFSECRSLIHLPDISKWKTDNLKDMTHLFYKCSSLISLPDISKWNTQKV